MTTILLLMTFCVFSSLSAQEEENYSLFINVPYFEMWTMNPIYGNYYLEGVQSNELIYSRLWTWKKDISETSDLVDGITPQSFKTMLIPPKGDGSLWSWKIKIRQQLKWPDGEPLTAEDIKFTFDVYTADKTESNLKELLSIFKKIEVIDNETIKFFVEKEKKLSAKYIIPLVQILPKHKVVTNYLTKNSRFSKEPMGSGPYQFVPQEQRSPHEKGESKIIYEKNDHYYRWGKNSNISAVKVKIESVVADVINDLVQEPRSEDWSTLDLVLNVPNSQDNFKDLTSKGEHLTFKPYNSNSWYGIALNCEKPFLKNRDIRMALTYAVKIEQTINDRYTTVEKGGTSELVAHRISGPFNPLWGVGDNSLQPIKYDRAKAKLLLTNNGVREKNGVRYFDGNPVELKLIYNSGRVIKGSSEENVITDLSKNLKSIGIKVKTVAVDATSFRDKLARGDYDMVFQYYELGSGSNIAALFSPGNIHNISHYSQPALTSYMDRFNRSSGVQKHQYGKNIHQIIYKDAPYIFLYRLDKIMAYRMELETNNQIVPKYVFTHIGEWYFNP